MSFTDFIEDPAFRTIVDRFVSEIPDRMGRLTAAIEEERFDEAKRLAHQLKGAGGSFGFPAITTAAAQVETNCLSRDADGELAGSVDRLNKTCEQVAAEWSAAPMPV